MNQILPNHAVATVALHNGLSADRGAEESVMETVNIKVSRAQRKVKGVSYLSGGVHICGSAFIALPLLPTMMEKTHSTQI